MSFNYHLKHFGEAWDIELSDGTEAYSGCVGFGLERLALALFKHHGLDSVAWPTKVRKRCCRRERAAIDRARSTIAHAADVRLRLADHQLLRRRHGR